MTDPFANAASLDDWLTSMTDEEFNQIKGHVTPGYADQLDAARRDGITDAEQVLGNKAQWVERDAMPDWLRLGMYDTLLKWFSGEAQTCLHVPRPDRPQPVFAAAAKPGLVVCQQCTFLLVVRGVADATCDGCGHVCTGPPDDPMWPGTAFTGPLGYMYGACKDCQGGLAETVQKLNT